MEVHSTELNTQENENLALNASYYGHQFNSPEGDIVYLNIFSHPMSTKVSSPEQMFELKFRSATGEEIENERQHKQQERIYYAFLGKGDKGFSMVYPHQTLFNICFANGPDIEEKSGKGKVFRLVIKDSKKFNLQG